MWIEMDALLEQPVLTFNEVTGFLFDYRNDLCNTGRQTGLVPLPHLNR